MTFKILEDLVDDDLAPFANLQLDSRDTSRTVSCATSDAVSPPAPAAAATSTTKKKRGRPKGSKNKPRKMQRSEQLRKEKGQKK